jgi:hypothetical protein
MVFTGAVALFTLMLVGATALLYRAGERQLAHLDRTAKRELRAYVFVDTVHIKHILDGNGVPEAVVRVKNFGQTPAYEACAVTGFAVSTHPPPQGLLTISDEALAESKTRSSMGPGQTEIVIASPRPQLNRPLTDQERYEVGSGGATIYVYGRIGYRDIFGDPQWTNFRFMVGGPVGVSIGGEMAGCEEGNEAT